jgi:hypothetical protein
VTTKEALSEAMSLAAAHTGRLRQLQAFARVFPQFEQIAEQHPDTIDRDLAWAYEHFTRLKAQYEAHCASLNVPAYATYNED